MPDLTHHPREQCLTASQMSVEITGSTGNIYNLYRFNKQDYTDWRCTCAAYNFSKPPDKHCKHIDEYLSNLCAWHEEFGIFQLEKGLCPQCGGPTEGVMFAV